ncbi:MAG TPA: hypothetical protein VI756_17930 [Blastocatellia bacterium]
MGETRARSANGGALLYGLALLDSMASPCSTVRWRRAEGAPTGRPGAFGSAAVNDGPATAQKAEGGGPDLGAGGAWREIGAALEMIEHVTITLLQPEVNLHKHNSVNGLSVAIFAPTKARWLTAARPPHGRLAVSSSHW